MNPFRSQKPAPQEHEALMQSLAPLPVRGAAWPTWVKILSWVVLIVIGSQILRVATGPQGQNVNPVIAGCIIICGATLTWPEKLRLMRTDSSPSEISSSAMPDSSTSSISFLILRISISILFLLYLISDYQAARN